MFFKEINGGRFPVNNIHQIMPTQECDTESPNHVTAIYVLVGQSIREV